MTAPGRRQHFEQGRLFSVADIPTKKGPRLQPRANPNFDQPYGGDVIGKYLYHHSPVRNRASIAREGLQPRDPQRRSARGMGIPRSQTPEGVYFGPRDSRTTGGMDVWAVDTNKVSLRQDPDDRDNYWGFHYSEGPVPADALRLVHRGKRARKK